MIQYIIIRILYGRNIIDINNLNIFIDLIKTKNFSQTGKNFGISPTTVTRKINQLEDEIGYRLIINTTRVIELTDTGLFLFNRLNIKVNNLNDEINLIVALLNKNISTKQYGKLKLQLPMVLSLYRISPSLPKFKNLYPDIEIEIIYSNEQPDMENNNVDLALVNYPFQKYINKLTHVASKLIKLYCTKEYKIKYGTPNTLQELTNHNLVLYLGNSYPNNLSSINLNIQEINTKHEKFIEIRPLLITNNELHNYSMMLEGNVICSALENINNKSHELVHILPNYSLGEVKYYLIKGKSIQKQSIINTMADYIIDQISEIK